VIHCNQASYEDVEVHGLDAELRDVCCLEWQARRES
jgi:hypothetical protein